MQNLNILQHFVNITDTVIEVARMLHRDYDVVGYLAATLGLGPQATPLAEHVMRLKTRMFILIGHKIYDDPECNLLQRQFVESQATLGSTTGPTLFDVPTTHFPSDEPRTPGSAASVVPDIPLPDVTGGTTNMPPLWRPSVRPHRGPIQSGPRPHHRSDYRTGPAARHYPKSS